MPFKKFADDEDEARARAHPVVFGPPAANGNASLLFKKAVDSEAKQADGFVPRPNPADNTRRNSRNRSPPTSAPAPSKVGVSSRASVLKYESASSASPFVSDQAALIGSTSSKLQGHNMSMPTSASPNLSNTQNLPAFSETRELKARHSSPQEPASRFFTSAIQQLRPIQDKTAVSMSAEQQREEMAKERRSRRFNDPFAKGSPSVAYHVETQNAADQAFSKRVKGSTKMLTVEARDDMQDNPTEVEGQDGVAERDWQSTEPILGNCPDMCPESERNERERKGDLDKLERLDGDRNQTSRDLAVKKYTRTAEKHAALIRPISVLMKTMTHLLQLLNRGYDEELLSLHNFLWDRMRAVRMDLRMQHIFNEQAVAMHEQMIRFHILAMHELCEYAKGEGFSEGFDAHLNIEQMNKASVDLFHMYDDLRKSGNLCISEAEFRGYYALLKLDKHPGYVVEPAELSLDLAKMTPEMRNTPEVQFARKVARACRSGNYLAFFSLAREATYLQACLMHAHFSKLRSQAMAFLYSGLQRNQGIPLVQVEDWLGFEGEDIEALLEHHGFSLKNYEEPYMVKEGSFVNQGQDFQTRRSRLVEEKRSQIVKDDVLSSGQDKVSTALVFERISSFKRQSDSQSPTKIAVVDEEMPDYEEEEQPRENSPDNLKTFSGYQRDVHVAFKEAEKQEPELSHMTVDVPINRSMRKETSMVRKVEQDRDDGFQIGKRKKSMSPFMEDAEFVSIPDEHIITSRDKKLCTSLEPLVSAGLQAAIAIEAKSLAVEADRRSHQEEADRRSRQEEKERQQALKAEVNVGKVRLLLRKWRRRAADKAEERHWRQQRLEAAISSLHVGLPVQRHEKAFLPEGILRNHIDLPGMELDVMQVEDRRFHKIQRMWSAVDVIQLISPVLKLRNPSSKFLCWKLVMYSGVQNSAERVKGRHDNCGEWLLAKILHQMPSEDEEVFNIGNSGESICVAGQPKEIKIPVFYFGRDFHLRENALQDREASKGASGILYLISQFASLSEERGRLHALVNMLESDAKLPLLIVYTRLPEFTNMGPANFKTGHDDTGTLVKVLGLDDLDKSKVACWTVQAIMESYPAPCPPNMMGSTHGKASSVSESRGFYSEDLLKEGLSWLASKAPTQPNLRSIHVQDLVMENLQPFFKLLSSMDLSRVTPEMCVKTFNESLLKTANEVNVAATNCHRHWPPNELRWVFEKLMGERALSLPSPDWNDATYLQPVIEALSLCQLPVFPVISIPTRSFGSNVSLKQQRDVLEHMLHVYVNQICGSKHADPLNLQVVDAIIQKGCLFKQTALGRLLIPNWSLIFQQLYHMRLALLSGEPPAVVWVQVRESHETLWRTKSPDSIKCLGPTLDEMIEMEFQESLLQRTRVRAGDWESMNKNSKSQLSSFLYVKKSEVRDSRQQNIETLQDPLGNSSGRRDFTELIKLRTVEERELESMVSDFCKRVDQQITEAAKLEEGQEWAKQSSTQTCTPSTKGNNPLYEFTNSHIFADSVMGNARSYSQMGDASNGMDSLTQLLQHCENVQDRIDRTLKECFWIGEST